MQKSEKSRVRFSCSCGFEAYVLGEDNKENYFESGYAICRKCGKKIFIASCPNCRYGQVISEKKLKEQKGQIKCFICEEFFPVSQQSSSYFYSKTYTYDELPPEIKKKAGRVTFIHFVIAYVIGMLISFIVIMTGGNKYFDSKSILGIMIFAGVVMYIVYLKIVKKKD